jgi:hypothetical protein
LILAFLPRKVTQAPLLIGKTACGRFSDIGSVSAGKKRGFCRLHCIGQRKSDNLPVLHHFGERAG